MNARLGSGLPYTPSDDQGNLGVATPNSETKPFTQMYDLKMYRNLTLGGFRVNAYVKIDNVFDIMNEYGVYGDTGTAGYTLAQLRAEQSCH